MKLKLTLLLVCLLITVSVLSQEFIKPELVKVGITRTELVNFLKSKKLYKEHMWEHPLGPAKYDGSYVLIDEFREGNKWSTARYEYLLNNDSVFTVKVTPMFWENWDKEILKDYQYVSTKKEELRTIYGYRPKDADYILYVVKKNNEDKPSKIQAFTKPVNPLQN